MSNNKKIKGPYEKGHFNDGAGNWSIRMSQLKPGDKFRFASWYEGGVFVYDYYRFEASYYAGQIRRERRYYYHRDGVKIKDKFGHMINLTESGCMNWQVYKVG